MEHLLIQILAKCRIGIVCSEELIGEASSL